MRVARPILWSLPLALLLVGGVAWSGRPSKRLSDEARGEQLYDRHCVQCHGATGAGDGAAAAALVAKVPDLRGQLTADNREEKAKAVLYGKGVMPGFESSFDKYDARRALRHMEKLAREGSGEPPAEEPDEPTEPVEIPAGVEGQ
jgi:cytochrome c553